MNIFGVGSSELILILLIMLVVAGPKRMIHWSYILGTYIGKLRDMWKQMAVVIQKEMDEAGVNVTVPKDIPTRQNLSKWVQETANTVSRPIIDPINETMGDIDNIAQVPHNDTKASTASTNAPTPSSDSTSLGTWSNTGQQSQGSTDDNPLGTWASKQDGDV